MLDTAGYGAVTINKAVSIVNQTSTAGATATSSDAITINAGAGDQIVLRGLTIVGAGTANNGIRFSTGGSLTVEDCSVSQFTGSGILFQPAGSAELHVSNTRLANNGGAGVFVQPLIPSESATIKAVFERADARHNEVAIDITGASSGQSTIIAATVADSVTDNNDTGILAATAPGFGPVTVMVRNDVVSNNSVGISVVFQAKLYLGRSTLSGNTTALANTGAGTLASYGDNNIDGNIMFGSTPTAVAFH